MNNQLIQKIITSNNLSCPEFTYENPVLDKNVAKALSQSFVKILKLSQQNSKVNDNLRLSILENIRKMCQTEPENHVKINENLTALLLQFYEQILNESRTGESESTDKKLDSFLIRNMKDMNLESNYKPPLNPEVVQALINLNQNGIYLEAVLKDVIHWNCSEKKYISIFSDLWTNENMSSSHLAEDIPIKLKPDIERLLLQLCHNILIQKNLNKEDIFVSDISLKNLIIKSSNSANCFQICCGILNYVFVMTNFDPIIQMFVQTFIEHVKEKCSFTSFSVLYPVHLSHIVVLLDINLEELPLDLKNHYVENSIKYLAEMRSTLENDLIMLLCQFPQWSDVYLKLIKD